MGRNARHHDRVSAMLLEAAAEEIAEHGPRASMADIAERAGVSRATIYNYFATREEMIEALEIAAVRTAESRLAEADLDSLSVAEALERLSVIVVTSGSQFSVSIQPLQDKAMAVGAELIRPTLVSLFRRGIEDGSISATTDLELLMSLYYGLILGAMLAIRTGHGAPESVGRAMARVFLNGVSQPVMRSFQSY